MCVYICFAVRCLKSHHQNRWEECFSLDVYVERLTCVSYKQTRSFCLVDSFEPIASVFQDPFISGKYVIATKKFLLRSLCPDPQSSLVDTPKASVAAAVSCDEIPMDWQEIDSPAVTRCLDHWQPRRHPPFLACWSLRAPKSTGPFVLHGHITPCLSPSG